MDGNDLNQNNVNQNNLNQNNLNQNNLNQNNLNQGEDRYVATQNLNTAIENPQINVSSATDVNVQDLGYNNQAVQPNGSVSSTFLNSSYETNNQVNTNNNNYSSNVNSNASNVTAVNYSVNNNTSSTYEPTLKEKNENEENSPSSLLHSGEFKVMILILFILCLFLLVMPYVYDFIKESLVK